MHILNLQGNHFINQPTWLINSLTKKVHWLTLYIVILRGRFLNRLTAWPNQSYSLPIIDSMKGESRFLCGGNASTKRIDASKTAWYGSKRQEGVHVPHSIAYAPCASIFWMRDSDYGPLSCLRTMQSAARQYVSSMLEYLGSTLTLSHPMTTWFVFDFDSKSSTKLMYSDVHSLYGSETR